ncbi:nucleoside 2-deoxyribosyltransferase [Sporosarcina phage Lietuvens]|nr:nucleoside 2-deoxyribosyltransferase [Sporosarcina phage Lietuvens]
MTKRIYLAHSISTTGEYEDSKRVANEIRALGYEVYVASENDAINDKTNEPTPKDIYEGDVSEILKADIFVVNVSGGLQDGTISEIGVVAGLNESASYESSFSEFYESEFGRLPANSEIKPIIAYTSNARLLQPQFYEGIASAGANHLVLGMVDKWGRFCGGEDAMLAHLKELAAE